MELQLQVTEEELLEFPEVRHNQINTSYTDNPAGEVVHSTEKKGRHQDSSRSRGNQSADTHSKSKVEKPYYKRPVAHRRQRTFEPKVYSDCTFCSSWSRKQKDRRLATANVHIPSIFDIKVRPNLTAFSKTLTPEALRYLHLGIDLGQTIGNCPW